MLILHFSQVPYSSPYSLISDTTKIFGVLQCSQYFVILSPSFVICQSWFGMVIKFRSAWQWRVGRVVVGAPIGIPSPPNKSGCGFAVLKTNEEIISEWFWSAVLIWRHVKTPDVIMGISNYTISEILKIAGNRVIGVLIHKKRVLGCVLAKVSTLSSLVYAYSPCSDLFTVMK